MRESLTQVKNLPNPDYLLDIPANEVHMQMGCLGCKHQVCFIAEGVSHYDIEKGRSDVQRLGITDKGVLMVHGRASYYQEKCESPCPNKQEIQDSVNALNARFKSKLIVPGVE